MKPGDYCSGVQAPAAAKVLEPCYMTPDDRHFAPYDRHMTPDERHMTPDERHITV